MTQHETPTTTPVRRPRRAGTPAAVLATVAAAALLAGCGVASEVAGVQEPPTEVTTTAPMTQEQATKVAARVLGAAAEARAATGTEAEALRRAALTGPALAMASAASRTPAGTPGDAVSKPAEPNVVALSRGTSWPRHMVVTTTDGQAQQIHLLVAPDARTPFREATAATVRAGEVTFGDLEQGAELKTDGSGMAVKPAQLLTQYAAALTYPKPSVPQAVSVSDPFAAQIRTNVAAQAKALGALATVGESHVVDPRQTVALGLADGGVLVFGLLTRTDTVKKTAKAQTLAFSGRTIKDSATLVAYESVVLAVPAKGKASLIAADEQLVSSRFR